jgi:hypothetical protein
MSPPVHLAGSVLHLRRFSLIAAKIHDVRSAPAR